MVEFIDNIPENESVGVCVILVDKWTNKIYLAERKGSYETGKYCCPGGMVEPNEDYISALIREVKEETGLQLKFQNIKFVAIAKHQGAKSNYTMWFKYHLDIRDIPSNLEPDKHGPWSLFNKQEALRLSLMLSTRDTIGNYL
jgi:ADP-ribose pyrophosphatase YjhB (NUDIX family)